MNQTNSIESKNISINAEKENNSSQNYPKEAFYSFSFTNQNNSFWFLILSCLPYLKEITELFFSTFFKNPVNPHPYIEIAAKIFALFVIVPYFIFRFKNQMIENTTFWWLSWTLFVPAFETFGELFEIFKKEKIFSELAEVLKTISLLATLIYVFVFDKSIINGFKSIFHDGYYCEQNQMFIHAPSNSFSWKKFGHFFTIAIGYLFVMIFLNYCVKVFESIIEGKKLAEPTEESQNNLAIRAKFKVNPISVIFSALIIAPLIEEIVYRQLLIKMTNNTWLSIFISSFIFGIIHLNNEPLIMLLGYMVPSLTFGFVYCKYRNIFFTILMHFLWNLLAVISIFIR